ncbi:MAG: hypothetical protein ACT4TC_10265 [Myxococcaceae bacterium]
MSLLPEEASFEELVQECFLAHRGAGLMLSPLDLQLVGNWVERGVPFDVVARGIRQAAEKALFDAKPGEPVLRTLRGCKREVEGEHKKFLARSAGAGDESAIAPDRRAKKVRSVLKKIVKARPDLGVAINSLATTVLIEPLPGALDERLEAGLLRALPFVERLERLRESRALAKAGYAVTPHAKRLSLRFHRGAVIRRHLSINGFW